MIKRILTVALVLLLSLSMPSCAFVPLSKNRELYNTVSTVSVDEETGKKIVRYQGFDYVRVDGLFDKYDMKKVAVGIEALKVWELAIGYQIWYYGDTADHPIYLYATLDNGFFLRADYDYEKDEFVPEGAEEGFAFSQFFTEERVMGEEYERVKTLTLSSKTHPVLRLNMTLCREPDGRWSAKCGEKWYMLSSAFEQCLRTNGIIE